MKRCDRCGEPMPYWPRYHNCGRALVSLDRLRELEDIERRVKEGVS